MIHYECPRSDEAHRGNREIHRDEGNNANSGHNGRTKHMGDLYAMI